MDDVSRSGWGQRASELLQRVRRYMGERAEVGQPPTVLVRRRSHIAGGRLRMHFEATLFGDNPFDLERFGTVLSREETPLKELEAWAEQATHGLRYYVVDPRIFATAEEASAEWAPIGARICIPPIRT